MNVVDSSAWLEYFADGPNAEDFAAPIEDGRQPDRAEYLALRGLQIQRSQSETQSSPQNQAASSPGGVETVAAKSVLSPGVTLAERTGTKLVQLTVHKQTRGMSQLRITELLESEDSRVSVARQKMSPERRRREPTKLRSRQQQTHVRKHGGTLTADWSQITHP